MVYRNKFKSIKNKIIQNYYTMEFAKSTKDIKKTWSVIKSLVGQKTSDTSIHSLIIIGVPNTDKSAIAENFNNYFTGIAQNLSAKIPKTNTTFNNFMNHPSSSSFAVNLVTPQELLELNSTLKFNPQLRA